MAEVTGSEILARALKNEGTKDLFFIMGGPMQLAQTHCAKEEIRMIDVRHEQAAALSAQAYSRLLQKPGVCMAASGPGVINLTTGIANALIDCAPVVAIGGSSAISLFGRQTFQEIDQVAIMKACTKWSDRVVNLKRIPEQVNNAFQKAMGGKPGPVYLDFPADVLYEKVPEEQVDWRLSGRPLLQPAAAGRARARRRADRRAFEGEAAAHRQRQRRDLVAGVDRDADVRREGGHPVLHDAAGPRRAARRSSAVVPHHALDRVQGRRPDPHPRHAHELHHRPCRRRRASAPTRRSRASISTRTRSPPSPRKVDIGDRRRLQGRAAAADRRRCRSASSRRTSRQWRKKLAEGEAAKRKETGGGMSMNETPIHPLRLCEEVKNFMKRDAILCVDGQEILNFGRQSMPTFAPAHRLNSGPFGMMGVGMPFGVGAKVACPDKQVIVVHGDGSFGLNAMELDTAVRHKIPVLVVISLNGGWTADPKKEKIGRNLGYTRFDKMAEALGCYGEIRGEAGRHRPGAACARRRKSMKAWSRSSTSRPTTRHAPARCPSRRMRPR